MTFAASLMSSAFFLMLVSPSMASHDAFPEAQSLMHRSSNEGERKMDTALERALASKGPEKAKSYHWETVAGKQSLGNVEEGARAAITPGVQEHMDKEEEENKADEHTEQTSEENSDACFSPWSEWNVNSCMHEGQRRKCGTGFREKRHRNWDLTAYKSNSQCAEAKNGAEYQQKPCMTEHGEIFAPCDDKLEYELMQLIHESWKSHDSTQSEALKYLELAKTEQDGLHTELDKHKEHSPKILTHIDAAIGHIQRAHDMAEAKLKEFDHYQADNNAGADSKEGDKPAEKHEHEDTGDHDDENGAATEEIVQGDGLVDRYTRH